MKPNVKDWERAALICREVAELPDRTSPEENADFMLVTGDELQPMLAQAFADLREQNGLTENQIKYLVDRFLGWRLPENFNPDAGISFTRPNYHPSVDATPYGTNLFDAEQASAMVRFMIEGMPPPMDGSCVS